MRQQVITVSQFDIVLNHTPIVYEGEPLLLAELDDIFFNQDIWKYVQRVDGPLPTPVELTVLLGLVTSYFDRWPLIKADAQVPTNIARFNRSLFKNYDQVRRFAFKQSDIVDHIEEELDVDVIVLLLIDELSYADWMHYPNVWSCLVEGPTLTLISFRNVVGSPTIARCLFERGFHRRLGFTLET